MIADILIVGSGASAVHAAFPLIQKGLRVTMLDMGNEDQVYRTIIPDGPFKEIRMTDQQQHRYFLGDRFEGIPLGPLQIGPQLTPPRQYITAGTEDLTPIDSRTFQPSVSLALGGMASGWAAGAMGFCEKEIRDFPISYDELLPHYETVSARIGVSGEMDDLYPFDGEIKTMLPSLRIGRSSTMILDRYHRRRAKLNAAGFHMGKPRLAALSQPHRGRGPDRYLDMSFWSDADGSVWRPRYMLNEFLAYPNFKYERPILVSRFVESNDATVEVIGQDMETGQEKTYKAKKLILAAGVLGTTRIVLRSLNRYDVKVPFVCNPYSYYPMLNIGMLGKVSSEQAHSLAELCVVYDPRTPGEPLVHGRVHSYRSLLNFKILTTLPLPYREAMHAARLLLPSLAILALDHEDRPSPEKYCVLHAGSPDRLEVVYSLSEGARTKQLSHEKAIIRQFKRLGCLPLGRIRLDYGASLHYGGTFPMGRQEKELTVKLNGLLREARSVYLVDSATFPYLPAKGMTFTMMANANRVGERIAEEFK